MVDTSTFAKSYQKFFQEGTIIIHILQMKKLSKIILAQGHS